MKRYFYSDPLAAAWMSKTFGFQYKEMDFSFAVTDSGITGMVPRIFYVHPDSMHLLEPREEDIFLQTVEILETDTVPDVYILGKPHKGMQNHGRIIERNGIAFIWPEVENG